MKKTHAENDTDPKPEKTSCCGVHVKKRKASEWLALQTDSEDKHKAADVWAVCVNGGGLSLSLSPPPFFLPFFWGGGGAGTHYSVK